MLLQELREEVAEYGRRMLMDGLTRGTGGYISAYDREKRLIAISPSGMDYREIEAQDVVIVDLDGNKLEGTGKPSTEWLVPKAVFPVREDINAIVHTHSRFATTIAALRWEIPAANFTLCRAGGGNVRCTDFHNFTSQELADDILDKMKERTAVLMGNHGLVACGIDLKQAYGTAEEVEFSAEVFWRAKCVGEPTLLTDKQVRDQLEELGNYYAQGQSLKNS